MEDLLIIYVLLCFSNFFADRENASGNSWDIPILQQPCTISSIRLPKTRHTNYSQKHCKCQQNRINTAFLDLKTTVFNCLQIPPKQKIRKPSKIKHSRERKTRCPQSGPKCFFLLFCYILAKY